MTALDSLVRRRRRPAAPSRRAVVELPPPLSLRRRALVLGGLWLVYLLIGLALSYDHQLIAGDALSRVASARFALDSRDPHLSAIGFVFTPLTTLLELPLVAVMAHWPDLLAHNVPAIVVSSLAMAAAVCQLPHILRERHMSRRWVIGLTAVLAAHPMIVLYAGNGMSEALFLLFAMLCVRCLLRWQISDDVHDLAGAGLSVAAAYLVRYDAVAIGAGCCLLVAATTFWRTVGSRRTRRDAALMDAAVVGMPLLTAFTLWALISWLVTGEAFAQFSSQYGNSAILAASGSDPGTAAGRLAQLGQQMLAQQPGVIIVGVVAVVVVLSRRATSPWPPLAVFGTVLIFQALLSVQGATFGLLRFTITVIPLTVLLVALMRPRTGALSTRRAGPAAGLVSSRTAVSRRRQHWTTTAAWLLLLPAVPLAIFGMARPVLAPQEFGITVALAPGLADGPTRLAAERQLRTFGAEREIAAYLDRQGLPEGAVLTDTVYGFAVVVASAEPRQFTITSDVDFDRRLNDPAAAEVRYLLAVPPDGRGATDALNLRWPTLYETGAGIAGLEMEFPTSGSDDQPRSYRLYRLY